MTPLAKQIHLRMKARNISTYMLEKKAGLKTHVVQNILMGRSKKPSAQLLHAIAGALDCAVEDLLAQPEFFEGKSFESKEKMLASPYTKPQLLEKVVHLINAKISDKKELLTIHQVLTTVEEAYLFAVQNNEVTQDFVDWSVPLMYESIAKK